MLHCVLDQRFAILDLKDRSDGLIIRG